MKQILKFTCVFLTILSIAPSYGMGLMNKNVYDGSIIICERTKKPIFNDKINVEDGLVIPISSSIEEIRFSQSKLDEKLTVGNKYHIFIIRESEDNIYDVCKVKKDDNDMIPVEIEYRQNDNDTIVLQYNGFDWSAKIV